MLEELGCALGDEEGRRGVVVSPHELDGAAICFSCSS